MSAESWRGVAAEHVEQLPAGISMLLRARTRRLLGSLLRPHRWRLSWLGLAVLIENLAALAGPYLVAEGIDRGIPDARHHDPTALGVIVGLLAAAALIQAATHRTFLVGTGRVGQDLLFDLRQRVFTHFQRLSISFHEHYTSGRVISRLTSDFDALSAMLDSGLDTIVSAALSIVGIGAVLLVLDWPLGLVAVAAFVPLLVISRWYQRASTVAYRRTRETVAAMIVAFTESLRGIRAVHAFRREPRNDEIFEQLNEAYRRSNTRSFQLLTIYWPSIRVIGNAITAVVLLYGGLRVIDHEMPVGVLAAFVLYLRNFFEPMADVSQFYDSFQAASAGLEKLAGVLQEAPAVPMPQLGAAPPGTGWSGRVEFRGVRFGYRGATNVLDGFDLLIEAGQTVALLGRTGAGKSTVARLLARFYDPVAGVIMIDGVALTTLAEPQLRRCVAMVTQENFLFSGSIAENISFGRPSASREQVFAAARAVGLDALAASLPGGLDAPVGKQGARLSAGQRQLVALARAMIADPAVLILDEASSSLDAPTERAVQQALRTVLARRTALIIAHRLSTVEIADRVVVLDAGRIVEDGSPGELIAGAGSYAKLHRAWADSLV